MSDSLTRTANARIEFDRVAVVGCGIMGSGVAQILATTGSAVTVCERDAAALGRGEALVRSGLDRLRSKGSLTAEAHTRALGSITWTTRLEDLADCDLVIEAVAESENIKIDLFQRLDAMQFDREVVLATNTSSIPVVRLAMATSRPDTVIGLHFFNPVPALKLVEIIPSLVTDEEVTSRVRNFAETTLGKTVVIAPDRSGFIVNALLIPYILDSIRMVETGQATAEDVDTAMRLGCAHPMGPLALADLIGLDTVCSIAESLHHEFGKHDHLPPPLLRRMVEAGHFGRKSKRGFHSYQ